MGGGRDKGKNRGPGERPIKVSTIDWSRRLVGKIWLIIAISIGIIFILLYIASGFTINNGALNFDLINNGKFIYLVIGLLSISSYGFYSWYDLRVITRQEQKFADFLRDLAEYWKAGLSMAQAINTLARGEYGILNKEIKKMSIQLSWGMPFNDVLIWLARELDTKLVYRSVSLILEANKAGGKIADVLLTAAHNASEIRWIKTERERAMKMYVWVIYISFGVYLAVILILVKSFLPAIIDASNAIMKTGGNGGGTATLGNMEIRQISRNFIVFLFFWSVIIQAIGNGLMTGIMGYGRTSAGLGHVFIMILMSWGAFLLTNLPQFYML